jgi:hypothetical protein
MLIDQHRKVYISKEEYDSLPTWDEFTSKFRYDCLVEDDRPMYFCRISGKTSNTLLPICEVLVSLNNKNEAVFIKKSLVAYIVDKEILDVVIQA